MISLSDVWPKLEANNHSTKCHHASRSQTGKLNAVAVNRIPTDDCQLVLKAGCDHLSEIDFDGLYEASFSATVCILAHDIRKKIKQVSHPRYSKWPLRLSYHPQLRPVPVVVPLQILWCSPRWAAIQEKLQDYTLVFVLALTAKARKLLRLLSYNVG